MLDVSPPLPNGQIVDWDRVRYDADTTRERSTRLKLMLDPRGPRAYWDVLHPPEREPRKWDEYQTEVNHFVMGHLSHEYTLEGKINWVRCEFKRGTKGWQRAVRNNRGKWIVSPTQDKHLRAWREAVMANPDVRALFESGRFSEQVIVNSEEVPFKDSSGKEITMMIDMKAALDGLTFSAQILSLKTTLATNRQEWEWELRKRKYWFSEAFHYRCWRSLPQFHGRRAEVLHVIVTKTENPACYMFPLSQEWLDIGDAQVRNALKKLAKCRDDEDMIREAGGDVREAWPDEIAATQSNPVVPEIWDYDKYAVETVQ